MDFLGRIRKLDSSLQRGLDNSFARVFGGKVVPNELEECLKQEIEDFLMQDADGRFLAPNDFRIGVSPKDFENLSAGGPDLPSELADRMARYCRNNGWSSSGTVSVRVQLVDSLHTGQLKTASQFTEGFRDQSGFFGADGEEVVVGPDSRGSLDDGSAPPDRSSSPASGAGAVDGSRSVTGSFGAAGDPDAAGTSAAAGLAGPDRLGYAAGAAAGAAFSAGAGTAGAGAGAAAAGAAGAGAGAAGGGTYAGGAGASESNTAGQYPDDPGPARRPEPAYPASAPSRPLQVPPGPASPEEPAITATLHLQDGSNRTFEVRPGSNIIGRGTISDFRLPDTGVSRQHAEITWDGRDAVLVDLHSTNGTMVNDSPIDNWLLADGDVISMGHSVMEVRIR